MSIPSARHRGPDRSAPPTGSRHRAEVRPRYGRVATLGSALTVTLIAVMGGTGALPSAADQPRAAARVTLVDQFGPATPSTAPSPRPADTADTADAQTPQTPQAAATLLRTAGWSRSARTSASRST